jgi:hypothetical protein
VIAAPVAKIRRPAQAGGGVGASAAGGGYVPDMVTNERATAEQLASICCERDSDRAVELIGFHRAVGPSLVICNPGIRRAFGVKAEDRLAVALVARDLT